MDNIDLDQFEGEMHKLNDLESILLPIWNEINDEIRGCFSNNMIRQLNRNDLFLVIRAVLDYMSEQQYEI